MALPAPHDRWPVAPPDGTDRIVAAIGALKRSWFHPVALRPQSRCKAIPSSFALGSYR
jgi:hypothetical protein